MISTNGPTSQVISDSQQWLERAVIGLNLCPFAKSVHVKSLIRYAISDAKSESELLADLQSELIFLNSVSPTITDTTLLIAPMCLHDFLEFNQFILKANKSLTKLDLDGIFQIATLHPQYQFAGTDVDDITNYTNRAPYPTLHLLRESSIDRALQAIPNAESIFEVNMNTMRRIGLEGWRDLGLRVATTTISE
ncbi:MAG: DUF1415 domain-containing protein [Polaromonas sp.]|jgi:hypothetical protein|nr:DUF1415 domain-containing protein [Polaromonas sp.]MBP7115666.1 DUF1415 domain-containing protein [Polaromonas sp.]MBP7307976.1 DUF1415 domain-containing protein [Polaromonas sp.]MBP9056881.1 DUF1415 domain-containing protein [Polaromonas sp.]MBP9830096.1 DUF1415 domain-containing protein [Polaromonas sp.]